MPSGFSICVMDLVPFKSNSKLHITNPFSPTGFYLPVNLSQITDKGTRKEELHLVIDENSSIKQPIYYAIHALTSQSEAIRDLRQCESTKNRYIGFYNIANNTSKTRVPEILPIIKEFMLRNYFDIAIWHDLSPNFKFRSTSLHSPNIQIQKYLRAHPVTLFNTQNYIKSLPKVLINTNPLLWRISQDNFIPKRTNKKFI